MLHIGNRVKFVKFIKASPHDYRDEFLGQEGVIKEDYRSGYRYAITFDSGKKGYCFREDELELVEKQYLLYNNTKKCSHGIATKEAHLKELSSMVINLQDEYVLYEVGKAHKVKRSFTFTIEE